VTRGLNFYLPAIKFWLIRLIFYRKTIPKLNPQKVNAHTCRLYPAI